MDATQGTIPKTPLESDPTKINRSAAGSQNSLGAEGTRDDHPLTDDGTIEKGTIEKIDKETPSLAGN